MGQKDMPRRVVILVEGGIASVAAKPPDVDVEIRDYDVEGESPGRLDHDPDGEPCTIAIYRGDL